MTYTYETIEDILTLSAVKGIPFWQVVLKAEAELTEASEEEVLKGIEERVEVFRRSVYSGLGDRQETRSGLSGGQARKLEEYRPFLLSPLAYRAMTYAIAVSEANAKMFKIVACPTAGSCGIVPGCMLALGEEQNLPEERYVEGLLTAAGIGNVITNRACVAGAVGGCQAECGTACAMAAGAIVQMLGGTATEIAHAAALALKNVLGLVCDPVAGLVEVPCVKRNGLHAVHSLSAAEMALAGLTSAIPVDEVIMAMDAIGRAMPASLRETSEGGLAMTKTGLKYADKVKNL